MTIAIIGAGMAGLAAARRVSAGGVNVVVFDKGRGPGGRMSTRRADSPLGELRFDHGAQYFTASDPGFVTLIKALNRDGHIARWTGRMVEIDATGEVKPADEKPRFVGVPGMNGVIRAMADGLDVRFGHRAVALRNDGSDWRIAFDTNQAEEGPFEAVLVAIPAPQAADLLGEPHERVASAARNAVALPNWTVMLAFETSVSLGWDGARCAAGPIGWAARNASKPGRDGPETWVIQSAADWAQAHLEDDADSVAQTMTQAFAELADTSAVPVFSSAHRWRYAFPAAPDPDALSKSVASSYTGFHWDPEAKIGLCGDWCLGPRVECAWLSGDRLGAAARATSTSFD